MTQPQSKVDSMLTPSCRACCAKKIKLRYVKYNPEKSPFQRQKSTNCRLMARNFTHVISNVNNRSLFGDQGGVPCNG